MLEITPEFLNEVVEKATVIFNEEQISKAFDQMAIEMRKRLSDKNCVVLPVMNGGLMTASEICKRIHFPLEMDYLHATRYRGEVRGGASIHWKKEPEIELEGRNVLIIDDILDGGLTLSAIIDYCKGVGAQEVYTAVLLDKVDARAPNAIENADFTGLSCGNEYVFGFGLDYHEYLRNLPCIYKVAPEHMI